MTFRKHLRLTGTGAIVAFSVLIAPSAEAKQPTTTSDVHVCNQATQSSLGGDLTATDAPTGSPAERFTSDLRSKPGSGQGLVRAAEHSPALTLCAKPSGFPGGGLGDVL